MALVVFLRGINVGGHRRFRPKTLAAELDAVNIGATGTFVVTRRIGRAQLRAEVARRLPFAAEIVICDGRDILDLLAHDPFEKVSVPADAVRFVSVLSRRARRAPAIPVRMPDRGPWLLQVLEQRDRFVLGVYRRHMKVIGYLGSLDELFGAPATTRSWGTMAAIATALRRGSSS